jgi:hypothetical protein
MLREKPMSLTAVLHCRRIEMILRRLQLLFSAGIRHSDHEAVSRFRTPLGHYT